MIAPIRTFIAGMIVPGWGYWIVGRRKHGFVTACSMIALLLIFAWTRLILDPVGFRVLLACLVVLLVGAALHSALIEFRNKEIVRNWKYALFFAGAYLVVVFLLFSDRNKTLGYETFRLPANSMAPTLLAGDYIVVDTRQFRNVDPANGEIVVFEVPDSDVKFIKRIVGTPGDSVSLLSNQLARNGRLVDEPYAAYDGPTRDFQAIAEQTVPPGHYFLLGDNRNNSRDSRFFGAIPKDKVIGRISHIYYSYDRESGIRWDRIPTQFD